MKTNNSATQPIEQKLWRYAFARVTVLVLLALFLAALLIAVANDLYAFVKPDRPVTLTVASPMSLSELSQTMSQSGVIQNPTLFRLYVQSKGRTSAVEAYTGTLHVNASMSYRELLLAFTESSE